MITIEQILTIKGVKIANLPQKSFRVAIDTRVLEKGDIFIALPPCPTNHGGHYIPEAINKGCIILFDQTSPVQPEPHIPAIEVPCVFACLRFLTRQVLANLKGQTVLITGSHGKTTVKEMFFASDPANTYISAKSYNSRVGFALTALNITPSAHTQVFELGISKLGEMDNLISLFPLQSIDVAIITSIAPAHLEGLGSITRIIDEKSKIFTLLKKEGTVVIEGDRTYTSKLLQHAQSRNVITFGEEESLDVCVQDYRINSESLTSHYKLKVGHQIITSSTQCLGVHMVRNIACCVAGLKALKRDHLEKYAAAIEKMPPFTNRGAMRKAQSRTIFNCSYNAASNKAVFANIKTLCDIATPDKAVLVLGDMAELGEHTEQSYQELLTLVSQNVFQRIYLYGPNLHRVFAEKEAFFAKSHKSMALDILNNTPEDAIIMVQGARGQSLDIFVNLLCEISE